MSGKGPPDPHHIYNHGVRFLVAESCLREVSVGKQPLQDWVTLPALVLLAFASEVFLKCLLILDGVAPRNTHDVDVLFEQLQDIRKKRIEELWDEAVAARASEFETNERLLGVSIPRDLKSALLDCGNAFRDLRYVYEDPKKAKFYILDFAAIVRKVISEARPEWG